MSLRVATTHDRTTPTGLLQCPRFGGPSVVEVHVEKIKKPKRPDSTYRLSVASVGLLSTEEIRSAAAILLCIAADAEGLEVPDKGQSRSAEILELRDWTIDILGITQQAAKSLAE